MAEEAVISELVSVGIFPVKRENTGKFRRSRRERLEEAPFFDDKSAGYAKIPYASEQGLL